MKSTGIVRTVDSVGRFVIPMELRRTLGITDAEDALEVFVEKDMIILRKYSPSCIFCKSLDDVVEHCGQKICRECIEQLHSAITTEATEEETE